MIKNLKGKKFGRLLVLSFSHIYKRSAYWNVVCECGTEKKILGKSMSYGTTKSCGCLSEEERKKRASTHKMSKTRIYTIWHGIKRRGTTNFPKYENITICEEWLIFQNFYNDMYDSYMAFVKQRGEKNTTIDRKNNKLGYNKENCRWATYAQQNRNTSRNHNITYCGKTKCLQDFAGEYNIRFNTLLCRLQRGWSLEKAFTKPVQKS